MEFNTLNNLEVSSRSVVSLLEAHSLCCCVRCCVGGKSKSFCSSFVKGLKRDSGFCTQAGWFSFIVSSAHILGCHRGSRHCTNMTLLRNIKYFNSQRPVLNWIKQVFSSLQEVCHCKRSDWLSLASESFPCWVRIQCVWLWKFSSFKHTNIANYLKVPTPNWWWNITKCV